MFLKRIMLRFMKNKAGASMVFVLFAMSILMVMASSAMVATGSAVGLGVNQRNYNQLKVYSESINKSIMYALQKNGSDAGKDIRNVSTLGGQMLRALYNYADNGEIRSFLPDSMNVSLDYFGLPVTKISIEYETLPTSTNITPSIPASPAEYNQLGYLIKLPVERKPKKATIESIVKFIVYIKVDNKEVKVESKYNFFGASLEDNGISDSYMIVEDVGEWRMMGSAKVDI